MADDSSPDPISIARLSALRASIVSAHIRGSEAGAAELPRLTQAVRETLGALERDTAEAEPAVPVRRSVRPDAITRLECGARMKVFRRHLTFDHGLSLKGYRARWGLPADYPTPWSRRTTPTPARAWPSRPGWDAGASCRRQRTSPRRSPNRRWKQRHRRTIGPHPFSSPKRRGRRKAVAVPGAQLLATLYRTPHGTAKPLD